MSTTSVCGQIVKQSRLGLTWNHRYLAVIENEIKIYKNKKECENAGKCKYSFNITETKMEKVHEIKDQVKIEVHVAKKKYRFQLTKSLWISLAEYYTNIHNPITPKYQVQNENAVNITTHDFEENEEQKTQDTNSMHQTITESHEITINVDMDESQQQLQQDTIDEEEVTVDIEPEIESKTEETEIYQSKYKWNEKYKDSLDIKDEAEREKFINDLVSEFCSICKIHCIDFIAENVLNNEDEIPAAFIQDEIEFNIIKTEDEYHKTKLFITNCKQYIKAFDEAQEKIYCPLSCIFEYSNLRIYCKASSPFMIAENLIFGKDISEDTFRCNEKISELLHQAATKLNLSSHPCKYDESIEISTSSNIRVYEKEHNVYYMDGIAELYPVDIVHFIKTGPKSRFHPKLVQLSNDPISSDAFIPPCDDQHDEIASKLIYNLHSVTIPKFAESINHLKLKILDCQHLEQMLAEKGINVEYIGEIYSLCKVRYAQEIMAILMIADSLKQQIYEETIMTKKEFKDKIACFINLFTNNDSSNATESEFKQKIIASTNRKYGVNLNEEKLHKLPHKLMKHELRRTLKTNIILSVPDKYIVNIKDEEINPTNSSSISSIQSDWIELKEQNCDITESCLSLLNRIDRISPFHVLKFDIMYTICSTYLKSKQNRQCDQESMDYCCSLYDDCCELSTVLFGAQHPQTLMIQIELAKFLHSNNKLTESVDKLENLLKSVQNSMGATSVHAATFLSLLSNIYLTLGDYDKSHEFGKQLILILDEKKRFNDEYINAHLQMSLIAEKTGDHALGIRFLHKLYNHLKKKIEKENKQKLWENIDIKMLCISISRMKLKLCTGNKFNQILKKWKSFNQNTQKDRYNEVNKCRELIIENLCLNPIKKTNDLLKETADTLQVICWINIIREFEKNFLAIDQ